MPGRTQPTSAPASRRGRVRSSPRRNARAQPLGSASAVLLLALDPRDELLDVAGAEALDVGVGPLPDLLVAEAPSRQLLARVVLEDPGTLERTQLLGFGLGDTCVPGSFGCRRRFGFRHDARVTRSGPIRCR